MKRIFKLCLAVTISPIAVSAVLAADNGTHPIHPRQLVGFFTNMEMYPETLDCSGYSVWLYRIKGKTAGNFHFYQGDCASRKIPLDKVTLDAAGDLSFEVVEDDLLFDFNGKLSDDRLAGVMTVFDQVKKEDISRKNETLLKVDDGNQRPKHAEPKAVTTKVDQGSGAGRPALHP